MCHHNYSIQSSGCLFYELLIHAFFYGLFVQRFLNISDFPRCRKIYNDKRCCLAQLSAWLIDSLKAQKLRRKTYKRPIISLGVNTSLKMYHFSSYFKFFGTFGAGKWAIVDQNWLPLWPLAPLDSIPDVHGILEFMYKLYDKRLWEWFRNRIYASKWTPRLK